MYANNPVSLLNL